MKISPFRTALAALLLAACNCVAHAATFTVSTNADSGAGSLRQAVLNAASVPGADNIAFTVALSGQTIALASEIVLRSDVTIDASSLPGGVAIDGGFQNFSLLSIDSSSIVSMHGLTLIRGGTWNYGNVSGGAIRNQGTLTLTRCGLFSNRAPIFGGAIYSSGVLTLTQCAIFNNSTNDGDGGAIYNGGTLELTQCDVSNNVTFLTGSGAGIFNYGNAVLKECTFSANQAEFWGGAIANSGTLALTHCTFNGNFSGRVGGAIFNSGTLALTHCTASNGTSGLGGAIFNSGWLTLTNTIIAGNTVNPIFGYRGDDIYYDGGTITPMGMNLIGNNDTVSAVFPAGPLVGTPASPLDARLAPLGNYGGPTQTMALLPGSPAINAATSLVPPLTTDQRGYPIVGAPDIGAYEAGGVPIDIKPGESPNSINPKSNGVIPVAILTTDVFDATTVDPLSVRFGRKGAREAHGRGHLEDVNGDSRIDLVLHFRTQATGIVRGDTSASLTGQTFGGLPITGTDSIQTVGGK